MSRFGWAYVNDVITGSGGGTPGGSDKAIQFASGSTFSGSTNFTFDYDTNTVRLTGTLYADNLIVSSSTIYKSGSTKFGDDLTDTHQFTGSLLLSSSYISETDYIDFNVAASAPSYRNGRVYWNNTDGCLDVYNSEADITLQVGQENWTRIYNDSGVFISNGTVVRLDGTHGDVPTAVKAQSIPVSGAVNVYNQILGLATHDIDINSFGYITTQGLVRGLNTSDFNDGDMLFVSSSAGLITNVPPTAPYEIIPIGVCVKASPGTSGIIYVAVQQPVDFSDLSSVYVSGDYSYGDIFTYVSSSTKGYWTHTSVLSGTYGITGSLTISNTVTATSASFLDYVQLGTSLSDEAYFNASLKTNIQPALTNDVDLGASSRYWRTGYITTLSSSAISSSVSVYTSEVRAGSVVVNGNISGSGNINGSGLQITGGGSFGATVNVTGTVSSSIALQTGGSITAASNITSTGGTISSSAGIDTAGPIRTSNGLFTVGGIVATGSITTNGTFTGDGSNITGIDGSKVNGVGDDWAIQFKDGATGTLTGSSNLTFSGSALTASVISASSYIGNGSGLTGIGPSLYTTKYLQTFIPSPNSLQIATIPYTQAVIKNAGGGSIQGNGAPSIKDGVAYGDLTTGNTADTTDNTATYFGWSSGLDNDYYTSSLNPVFRTRIRTDSDITNMSIFTGLRKASVVGAGSTVFTNLTGSSGEFAIGVAYITSSTLSTNGEWILYTQNGTPTTRTSTGVSVTADTIYDIMLTITTGSVTATINNVPTSTTGTIPNNFISPYVAVATLTSSVKKLFFAGYDVRY